MANGSEGDDEDLPLISLLIPTSKRPQFGAGGERSDDNR